MVLVDLSDPDVLPISADRASERLPIERTYTGTAAAPNRGLRVRMRYNDAMERWTIEVALGDEGVIVERRPVGLYQEYSYRDRVLLMFIDWYRNVAERVTPDNLGETVALVSYPGPESPGFGEWFADHLLDDTDGDASDDDSLPLLA